MCGIAGLLTSLPREEAHRAVSRMVRSLHHRGPDGWDIADLELHRKAGYLVLGHTRLSIIDLTERSSQPMHDEETGSWLAFNGEIYNFRELRSQMERHGVRFRSSGDTEVLLRCLVHWGTAALTRLRGMFSFAFWSGTTQELILVRDPLGIKPLYYCRQGDTFLFASEIKGLQASRICHFTPDPIGIQSFLKYGAVTGPNTVLTEVKELAPGCLLKVRHARHELRPEPYWSLREAVSGTDKSRCCDPVESVSARLSAAIRSHLVSDVPVGIFLSGGVDSSLLASVASKAQYNPTLLTIGFPEEKYSEIPFATEVAQKLSARHQVVVLTGHEFRQLVTAALQAMDQPSVDGLNTYVISGVASSLGLRVLLSGVGGDELFGGYTTFRKVPQLLRYQAWLRRIAPLASRLSSNPIQWSKIRQHGPIHNLLESYLLQRSVRWQDSTRAGSQQYVLATDDFESIEAMNAENGSFVQVASLELLFYLRNQLLRDADVFSMAHSVELRVPLLDLDLVTTALGIPQEDHFDWRGGKRIPRTILRQLGMELPHRRKQGFSFPWPVWLRSHLKTLLWETLSERELYHQLGLDPEYGVGLIRRFEDRDPLVSWSEVWSLFVLLYWHLRNRREAQVTLDASWLMNESASFANAGTGV